MSYFGTYERLGIHIGASDVAVIRAARRKLKPRARRDRSKRQARHAFYREILQHHHDARDLARQFRL